MTASNVPLPAIPAAESVTTRLPAAIERGLARFWDIALDAPDWPTRATALDLLFARSMDMARDDKWQFRLEATRDLITSLLEQLAEREISCLPQAMLYRCSTHPAWRTAAMRWMPATEDGTLEAWMRGHPALGLYLLRIMSAEAVS